jgi:threonylcarbamoyladenosine tRNA methylthiotransferase MtaB
VAEGYKEVVLTGTRIGSYGHDGGLAGLVGRILQETGIQRLRLSSLEPKDLTPELLGLWGDSRLCPHIHLPLQSGSESVLKRMGRAYSTAEYERAVALARELIPNLALTSDIMVGFPGESEDEFEESYRFCERIGFAKLHVFPYSARPGTKASRMTGVVKDSEKSKRCQLMLDLSRRSSKLFGERFLGRNMNVLWEGCREGVWFGLTENYLRVFGCSQEQLANELVETKMIGLVNGSLWGELERRDAVLQGEGVTL